jgi:hypothetical protein
MPPIHTAAPLLPRLSCSGFARELVKDLEAVRPSVLLDIVASAEAWQVGDAGGGADDEGDDDDDPGGRGGSGGCGGGASGRLPSNGGAGASGDGASVRSGATARSSASTVALATRARVRSACTRCGYMTSAGAASGGLLADRTLCQACSLLAGLDAGTPRVGLASGRQARRITERAAAAAAVAVAAVAAVGEGAGGGENGSECAGPGRAAASGSHARPHLALPHKTHASARQPPSPTRPGRSAAVRPLPRPGRYAAQGQTPPSLLCIL